MINDFFDIDIIEDIKLEDIDVKEKTNPFDYISFLTYKKIKWESLTTKQQKDFNIYLILNFFSHNLYLTDFVSYIYPYIINDSKEVAYKKLFYILPKTKINIEFIKAKKKSSEDEKFYKFISNRLFCSNSESFQIIKFIDNKAIKRIKTRYGL